MRKILELMKTPLIIPVIFAVLYCIVYIHTQLPKYDKEKIEAFDEIREEFYALNSYILTEYNGVDIDDMTDSPEKDYFTLMYDYDMEDKHLPSDIEMAVKHIMDTYVYDSIRIKVSDNWITYNVGGYNYYIFSRDGTYPCNRYKEQFKQYFSCFVLKDDWYLLDSWVR